MSAVALSVLGLIVALVFAAVVGLMAVIVQRKFGSKWLWVVWLAPGMMYTSFLLTRVDYTVHSMISRPVLWFATSNFALWSAFSGIMVWYVVTWFGLQPAASGSNGIPAGLLEEARGLPGILRAYNKLLETYARALNDADPNPYPSIPKAVLEGFRTLLPSSVRLAAGTDTSAGASPEYINPRPYRG